MNIAYILRGVPGSGKSTIAKHLTAGGGVIHSTDDFFYVNGKYIFDYRKLSEYHEKNFEAFCRSLKEGVSVVVCDNTNVRRKDFEPYVRAAEDAGYVAAVVTLPHPDPEVAAQRNVHNVSADTISRLIKAWED